MQFFIKKGRSTAILNWWLSSQNKCRSAKKEIHDWIIDYAATQVSREAQAVTKSKTLQTMGKAINYEMVEDFNFEKIHGILCEPSFAPVSMRILEAFSTSRRALNHTQNRIQKRKMVCFLEQYRRDRDDICS